MVKRVIILGACLLSGCAAQNDSAPAAPAIQNEPLPETNPRNDTPQFGSASDGPTTRSLPPQEAKDQTQAGTSGNGGQGGSQTKISIDPSKTALTIDVAGTAVPIQRLPLADHRLFEGYRDASQEYNAYVARGDGTEVLVYAGGKTGQIIQRATYKRSLSTDLPLTGTARMTGDYVGFTTTRRINGTASLSVDFAKQSVQGRVSDRVFRQRSDNSADMVNPLSDMLLEPTVLQNDGAFAGITGGGQIVNGQALWNPARGNYDGLIGGQKGDEAVGRLSVTHRAPNGSSMIETGGFLVKE